MAGEYYRQFIPDLELSVERATDNVPQDGKYHVLKGGRDLGSFRVLKQAQALFKQVVNESEYQPPPPPRGQIRFRDAHRPVPGEQRSLLG